MKLKQITYFSLAAIMLTSMSFVFHQAMTIIPGISAGNFYINKTNFKNIQFELGKGEVKKLKWHGPHCGKVYPYYKLVYEKEGISFVFYSQELKKNDKFETIELTEKFNGQTEKQISVGLSTRLDVYNAYGQPSDNKNIKYLEYENLGISFEFVNSKYEISDTLATIFIYQPTEISDN